MSRVFAAPVWAESPANGITTRAATIGSVSSLRMGRTPLRVGPRFYAIKRSYAPRFMQIQIPRDIVRDKQDRPRQPRPRRRFGQTDTCRKAYGRFDAKQYQR